MNIDLPVGTYVIAVSGGVDSVVLLDLAVSRARQLGPSMKLIVAHFDHGIRLDSATDRVFVQQLAARYDVPCVYDRAELGPTASEAVARQARYAFLHAVRSATAADAIVTAHHQDDLLETIIINMLRGTKSKGLSSLRSTATMRRPLLEYTKAQLRTYAETQKLTWHEDSTNTDESYLRNYVRKRIVPRLDDQARLQLLEHSHKAALFNDAIAALVAEYTAAHTTDLTIDRIRYRQLPDMVSPEILAAWLRTHTTATITTKLLRRLDAALRNGRNGSRVDIMHNCVFRLERETAVFVAPV